MMKSLFLILLLFLFCLSCKKQESTTVKQATPAPAQNDTSYHFPKLATPANYFAKDISVYDSVDQADYNAQVFLSKLSALKIFNDAMTRSISKYIRNEQSYVEPYDGQSYTTAYTLVLKPVAFYENNQFISATHVVDTYSAGGNHHNYRWFTFNYDKSQKRALSFTDVFEIKTTKDSLSFVALLNRHNTGSCKVWSLPLGHIDFSFTQSGISFNPNSLTCWGEHAVVSVDSCSRFMRKCYQ